MSWIFFAHDSIECFVCAVGLVASGTLPLPTKKIVLLLPLYAVVVTDYWVNKPFWKPLIWRRGVFLDIWSSSNVMLDLFFCLLPDFVVGVLVA